MAAKNTSMFFMARGRGAHGEPLKSHATDQMVLVISSPSTASKTFGCMGRMSCLERFFPSFWYVGWLKLQLRCGKARCYMTLYQGIWGTRWLCICIICVWFRTICASDQIMNAPELVTTGYDSLTHGSSLHSLGQRWIVKLSGWIVKLPGRIVKLPGRIVKLGLW
jgi:hypothetical protein